LYIESHIRNILCDRIYERSKARTRKDGDDILTVIPKKGGLYYLNATSTWIYNKVDGKTPTRDIIKTMSEKYNINENGVFYDILKVLEDMKRSGLVKVIK